MSDSESPSTRGPFDPPPQADSPADDASPCGPGAPSPEAPSTPQLYPFGRPPRSPFAEDSPRLGIIHFLVAMTGVAIYFSATRWNSDAPGAGSSESWFRQYLAVSQIVLGIPAGVALASLGFMVRWRRGRRYPVWPGEWLLLSHGFACVFGTLGMLALLKYETISRTGVDLDEMVWHRSLFFMSCAFLQAVIPAIAAFRMRIRTWRLYFSISALACLLLAGMHSLPADYIAMRCASCANVPCLALLLIAIAGDLAQQRRFPWTHWLGATLDLWTIVASLALTVAFELMVG